MKHRVSAAVAHTAQMDIGIRPTSVQRFNTGYVTEVTNISDDPVTSMDFSRGDSELLVVGTSCGLIKTYNILTAEESAAVKSTKAGVSCLQFSNHNSGVIFAPSKPQPATSVRDEIVTTTSNGGIQVWDIRSRRATAEYSGGASGNSIVSYDPLGRVFVVGAADGRILCYNPLMVDRGPCAAGSLPAARMPSSSSSVNWTGMSISPDDDVIVYSTQQAGCGVVNAVNLNPIAELSPGDDALARPIPSGVSLAPDNKSFIMADALGHILTYDLSHIKDSSPYIPPGVAVGSSPPPDSALRGSAVAVEDYTAPKHKRPVQALKWHPDRKLIASADTELALWIDPSS